MTIREEVKDLFTVDDSYWLAHCISADFALGAGIAVQFDRRFGTKRELLIRFPNGLEKLMKSNNVLGECIPTSHNVLNLVTKYRYFDKPTYQSMRVALIMMNQIIEAYEIKKIAMPTIGCGLDGLNWNNVRKLIENLYKDKDVDFLVCLNPQIEKEDRLR